MPTAFTTPVRQTLQPRSQVRARRPEQQVPAVADQPIGPALPPGSGNGRGAPNTLKPRGASLHATEGPTSAHRRGLGTLGAKRSARRWGCNRSGTTFCCTFLAGTASADEVKPARPCWQAERKEDNRSRRGEWNRAAACGSPLFARSAHDIWPDHAETRHKRVTVIIQGPQK